MAGPLVMPKNPYHVRSASMPSRSHPLFLRVEDRLQKLQTWGSSSPSTHPTTEMLCDGLGGLRDLHDSIEDLLQSPLTQQTLVRNWHGTWVNGMLNGSLRILDLCETSRDVFMLMKENAQDHLSALRRRRVGDSGLHNQVLDYISLRRKMKKKIHKCLKELERAECKFVFLPLSDKDQQLSVIIGVLREVRSVTISIFESFSSFISLSRPTTKAIGLSLISKWMVGTGRGACEVAIEKMSEVGQVDVHLCSLYGNKSCKDDESVENMQKGLKAMDVSLQSLVDRLECTFRHLIRTRVSLLNILNH
ncbi:uncharacterized protein LOC131225247 [Magnolia sinica]|uniref:uncharacterized protein LOC131225247 n=1 Tax=Magnolia sinica TaxID=86752 RepID=UPI00265A7613|nr:uncharacterized protein LOC131225247 [Magnolia sinica]